MTAALLPMTVPNPVETSSTPRPPPSMRSRALFALKLLVTVGLGAYLVHTMLVRDGVDALVERLSALSWPMVALAVVFHFVAVTAGTLRWQVLLAARSLVLPLGELYRWFLIGRFIGAFTPSTTGLDGYRALEVGRRTGQMATSAAVIVIEKLFGLVGMALVCAALLPFGLVQRLGLPAILVALAMAFAALLGLFVVASHERASWLAARAPGPLRGPAQKVATALAAGGLTKTVVTRALLLGVVTHLCLSATFAASGLALGIEIGLVELLAVGNAIVLAVLLPISVGGVGVREGAAVLLLTSAGVSTTDAVLLALIGYLTGQVPALLGGISLAAHRT